LQELNKTITLDSEDLLNEDFRYSNLIGADAIKDYYSHFKHIN